MSETIAMTQDEAFFADIIANPDDDAPRLIFSDWLTDHGNPRGEFIHVQCLLARAGEDEPCRPHLEAREGELLNSHQDDWLGPLRPLLCRWKFRRGFLDAVAMPAATYLRQATLPLPATVRRVEVDLNGFEPALRALAYIPESVASENVLVPIGFRRRKLVLAMQNPEDAGTLELPEFVLWRGIEAVAAPPGQIIEAIERSYRLLETCDHLWGVSHFFFDLPFEEEEWDDPVAKLVQFTIEEARGLHADLIRIESCPDGVRFLYRIGGSLMDRGNCGVADPGMPPRRLLEPIVARIRVLAGLGDNGGREQAGRIRGTDRGKPFDFGAVISAGEESLRVTITL